jgi:hypothetical protein
MKILILLILTHTTLAWSCGDYLIRANVVMKNGVAGLVINPDTQSEINLKVKFDESSKLSPYVGRMIESTVTIPKKMDFTQGVVSSIGGILVIAHDPLAPSKGTSLKLVKVRNCKK